MIHSGTLSYLTRLHKNKYGMHKYWMKYLNIWSDGKCTVEFIPYGQESNQWQLIGLTTA
jgi:hypothetical protein